MLPERALQIAVLSAVALGATIWLVRDSVPAPPPEVWIWSVDGGHPRAPDHLSSPYAGVYGDRLDDYHCRGVWEEVPDPDARTWQNLLLEMKRRSGVREDLLQMLGVRASGLDEVFLYRPSGMQRSRDVGVFYEYIRGGD